MLGLSAAGVPMNDDMALSVSTVATCIAMLADSIATLPLQVLKKTKDHSKQIIDPPPVLISDPWPEGTVQDWLTQVIVSLLLRGNFYGRIVDRDSAGYASMIQPIHPDRVVARRLGVNQDGPRQYRIGNEVVPSVDILHIPYLLVPGSFIGLNPVEYQRLNWGLAAASEMYGGQFFANSATPSGILTVEGDLSEEETLEMTRAWKQAHGGIGQAQFPAVLTGGVKFQQVSLTPDDAQFLGVRQFQREQIISWFRIPPHKVGITDRSPGPTLTEELETMFVMDALMPPASRIEQALNKLMRPSQVPKFDFSARMRANTLMRMQAAQIAVNSGLETADELRAREDLEPLPHNLGNVVGRPLNMTYYDADTGDVIETPTDAGAGAPNPGGLGNGGGDPSSSTPPTEPDGANPPPV